MPDSDRKLKINYFLKSVVQATIPILPHDQKAADWHAKQVKQQSKGISLPFVDTQMAAIAYVNNLVLVTRNINDFRYLQEITVENWFSD